MTASKAKSQRIFEEHCEVDRISCLPRNVIDCILELMPVRDAARTCVLSSKWRYVWADHPLLILDKDFWDDICKNRSTSKIYPTIAVTIVNNILLHHSGYIMEFEIDVSVVNPIPDFKLNMWLSFVCRRRVKVLTLKNSDRTNLYKVPSSVFSNSELTDLYLSYCIIKGKYTTIGCFTYIQSLILKEVTLDPMVLTTPLLTSLTLASCCGVRDFNISAPGLESLNLRENDYLYLKPFLTCKNIDYARLYSSEKIECQEDCESINLLGLLAAWPMISELEMDEFCFKYLATGNIPDTLQLNLRLFTLIEMALNAEVIAWILCILINSPLLHTFEIWFFTTGSEEVNAPSLIDYRIEQLRTIKMKDFAASKVEVMFATMLLRCAPVLKRMLVEENNELDQINILKNLLLLQQEFPSTKIIFGPNLVT